MDRSTISPCIYFGQVYTASRPGWVEREGLRSAYCLVKQLDGSSRFERGDERVTLRPGQVALTDPGTRWYLGNSAPVALVVFDLVHRERLMERGYPTIDDRVPFQPTLADLFDSALPLLVPEHLQAHAAEEVDALIDGYWVDRQGYLSCCGRLLLLVADLARCRAEDEVIPPDDEGMITRAERIMTRRFRHGCTVAEVARALGYSRQHFAALYRAARGHGPGAYLDRLQLQEASLLLRTTSLPVAEVARRSGLRSAAALNARFRRAYGTTPAHWRRETLATTGAKPAARGAPPHPVDAEPE